MSSSLDTFTALPRECFGTFKIFGVACESSVFEALQVGYRWIDTASVYKNEVEVGHAVRRWLNETSNENNDIITVTTKISPYELLDANSAALACLKRLSLPSTVRKIILIHWPGVAREKHHMTIHREARNAAWKVLCGLKKEGLVDVIGVSNFNVYHLKLLADDLSSEVWYEQPAINQVEMHVKCQQRELMRYCNEHSIFLQAYAPLGGLGAPLLYDIGEALQLDVSSSAAVLLQFIAGCCDSVVVKSQTPERIRDNFLNLQRSPSPELRERLSKMDENFHYCWDACNVV
ncbi:hypothetical protein FOL47_010203 [Perkinsus chesapeaki]|uniref:NADP-dependent oxidoreductase domain-containing protein n=1 Tax=Perkinsus chesapeaki TaxID=330153 RepID=A0A7J6L4G8_PERCH|nr:hypothetical protein FOL47_010203 [Perkinsus chesapeaki]